MKNLFLSGILIILAFNCNAQTYTGCVVGNTIYTSQYSVVSGGRRYNNNAFQNSQCGWLRSPSGQFNCFVYRGTGSKTVAANYTGPYPGGNFTLVACPIDNYEWFLFIFLGFAGRYRLMQANRKSVFQNC